jgi:hypothetical protein
MKIRREGKAADGLAAFGVVSAARHVAAAPTAARHDEDARNFSRRRLLRQVKSLLRGLGQRGRAG